MLRSAALSAQGGGPRPSAAWARDEARTGLPAHALVEFVLRLGMDWIEFDPLVEHFPLRRSAARRDRRRFARLAEMGENGLHGRRFGDEGDEASVGSEMGAS